MKKKEKTTARGSLVTARLTKQEHLQLKKHCGKKIPLSEFLRTAMLKVLNEPNS